MKHYSMFADHGVDRRAFYGTPEEEYFRQFAGDGADCPFCDGYGHSFYATQRGNAHIDACPACKGSGRALDCPTCPIDGTLLGYDPDKHLTWCETCHDFIQYECIYCGKRLPAPIGAEHAVCLVCSVLIQRAERLVNKAQAAYDLRKTQRDERGYLPPLDKPNVGDLVFHADSPDVPIYRIGTLVSVNSYGIVRVYRVTLLTGQQEQWQGAAVKVNP